MNSTHGQNPVPHPGHQAAESPNDDDPGNSPKPAGPADISLIDDTGRLPAQDALIDRLRAAAAHLRLHGELRIRVLADAAMEAAHLEYLDAPGTTDVITFDLAGGETEHTGVLDADLLLCLDEAERQAARRDHGVTEELLLYAIHGIMHCLGHDDHDDDAFARMHAAEDEVLEAIGVGPIFARETIDHGAPAAERTGTTGGSQS